MNKTFIPGIGRSEDYFTAGESLNSIFLATRSISAISHKQPSLVKLVSLFPLLTDLLALGRSYFSREYFSLVFGVNAAQEDRYHAMDLYVINEGS